MSRALALLLLAPLAACSGSNSSSSSASSISSSTTGSTGGSSSTGGVTSASSTSNSGGATTGSNSGSSTTGGSGMWLMGYVVGYDSDSAPSSALDFSKMTHVAIGVVTPNADGSLDTSYDLDDTNGPIWARDTVTRAHAAGAKALVMLGGAGVHDGWVGATSSAHLASFEANLVQLATEGDFDGFDFDWEPLNTEDEPAVLQLVEDIRTQLPNAVLTMPVGWVNSNSPTVDDFYGQVSASLNRIDVMTYGMAGAYQGWESWHSSALTGETASTPASVASSVAAYLAAGVPAGELGVGIGFYGSCWSAPVTAPLQQLGASQIVADDNVMTYPHIMQSYYSASAYHYDASAEAPYLTFASAHGAEGCTFVSYEDPTSIASKGSYARQNGLGGAIVWNVNEGYDGSAASPNALLDAAYQAFVP